MRHSRLVHTFDFWDTCLPRNTDMYVLITWAHTDQFVRAALNLFNHDLSVALRRVAPLHSLELALHCCTAGVVRMPFFVHH